LTRAAANSPDTGAPGATRTAIAVLALLCAGHLLNDMMQSLLVAIYPLLKQDFALSFTQIGLIALAYQLTASLLQPAIGLYTDRRPQPYALVAAMLLTLAGLCLLAFAPAFPLLLLAACVIGTGSAVFHPESARMTRIAAGRRPGLGQSIFQVGGTAGSALGPLLAAFVVAPRGRASVAWFALAAVIGMLLVLRVSRWYAINAPARVTHTRRVAAGHSLSRRQVRVALGLLVVLLFSKYFYLASLSSYYTFYLMSRFHVSLQSAQLHLFAFLAAVAVGTLAGGHLGDRIGRKYVIWGSILGVLPFSLALPYADLFWTGVLTVVIGLIIASAFGSIVVFAQELVPHRVGAVSGLFFGFAFGLGGVGAAVLGWLADHTSITYVYRVCAFLPALGLVAAYLPGIRPTHSPADPRALPEAEPP
jgi:FSR family fosmidomycin resistance protein-like MFS transporter